MTEAARTGGAEHIAVIGLGCRVPGADSPEALWRLLYEGRDEISRIPEDRAEFAAAVRAAGERATGAEWGGFLKDIGHWDPGFFGISPAEAARMDPQQALALEVGWRALEDAGIVPGELAGSRTGVFFGQATHDHAMLLDRGPHEAGPFTNPGLSHAITANRLSYLWDLRGPALSVDTACSSSLVAVHLAVRSLLADECDLALAGGVNALLSPVPQIGAAGLTALAADGRCRTFDAAGTGYVRSEGAGAVVLRRLRNALEAGDHIHAVIRATGVNQDGRTNGLTAPSGRAQTALIGDTLARAGVRPDDLGYAELHGTGTPLGDPIEARALAAGLQGNGGRTRPLAVGSVKANIGHLEAAAGILGLIKTALVLGRRSIPRTPHFTTVNPRIDLDRLGLRVPTRQTSWPDGAHCAAVSSFGFGGTNAHVVLSFAPSRGPRPDPGQATGPVMVPLSARDEDRLADLARSWADHIRDTPSWDEIRTAARAAAVHRTHFEWRAGVVAADREELLGRLDEVATRDRRASRAAPVTAPQLGFVYSGHGSQWDGMGRELLRTSPAFARRVHDVDAVLGPMLGWSPLEALAGEEPVDLDDIAVAQPLIMTVQLALTAGLSAVGLRPAAVVGHSMGEVSAAVAAGRLDLATGCRVLRARNDAVEAARGTGGMAVVEAGAAEAAAILRELVGPVVVAADNSPRTCVLSGPTEELAQVVAEFGRNGRDARLVKVDYPSHGPLMREPAQRLTEALGTVESAPGSVPFYSTVHGGPYRGALDTAYWQANLTSPVLAQGAVHAMADAGITHLLEISPHPVLLVALRECLQDRGEPLAALATAHRDRPARHGLYEVAAELYEHGWRPTGDGDAATRRHAALLPRHPFRRDRVHRPGPASEPAGAGTVPGAGPGTLVELAFQPDTFVADLRLTGHHRDHVVAGRPVLSATGLAALASWAAAEAGAGASRVRDLEMSRPVPADDDVPVQLVLHRGAGGRSAAVSFLVREADRWQPAARCTVGSFAARRQGGPDGFEARVDLCRSPGSAGRPAEGPSLLDLALPALGETLFATRGGAVRTDEVIVDRIDTLSVAPELWSADAAVAHGRLTGDDGLTLDLELVSRAGEVLAWAEGVRLRRFVTASMDPSPAPAPAPDPAVVPLRARLEGLRDDAERAAVLREAVRGLLGEILPGGLNHPEPDDTAFAHLGLESLMGVELRNRLEALLGTRLSVTLVWAQPTIRQLADALLALASGAADERQASAGAPQRAEDVPHPQDPLAQLLAELDHAQGGRP